MVHFHLTPQCGKNMAFLIHFGCYKKQTSAAKATETAQPFSQSRLPMIWYEHSKLYNLMSQNDVTPCLHLHLTFHCSARLCQNAGLHNALIHTYTSNLGWTSDDKNIMNLCLFVCVFVWVQINVFVCSFFDKSQGCSEMLCWVLKGQTDGQLKNIMPNMGPDVSDTCSYLESYQLTNTAKWAPGWREWREKPPRISCAHDTFPAFFGPKQMERGVKWPLCG